MVDYMLDLLAQSEFATGIDLNHWEGDFDLIESDEVLAAIDFVILRVGYGAQDGKVYKDIKFEQQYAELIQHPEIARIAYFYPNGNGNISEQIAKLMEWTEGKDFHAYAGDFEEKYNTMTPKFAKQFLQYMRDVKVLVSQRAGKPLKHYLYANRYDLYDYFLKNLTPTEVEEVREEFPLWLAQYPWKNWAESTFTEKFKQYWENLILKATNRPVVPKGYSSDEWEIWQIVEYSYLGHEIGLTSDQIDFNITRQTRADFLTSIGFSPPYIPPELSEEYIQGAKMVLARVKALVKRIEKDLSTTSFPPTTPPEEPPIEEPPVEEPQYKYPHLKFIAAPNSNGITKFFRSVVGNNGRVKLIEAGSNYKLRRGDIIKLLSVPKKNEDSIWEILPDGEQQSKHIILAGNLEINALPKDCLYCEHPKGLLGWVVNDPAKGVWRDIETGEDFVS